MDIPQGVVWNLVLAVVPVVLGYGLAWTLGRGAKQPLLKLLIGLPLALAWLAFLPSACYLLMEWRDLLVQPPWSGLLDDRQGMLRTVKWALFFLLYSGAGVLLFTLAIRPVEQWLRGTMPHPVVLAPFLFFLVSLGVYLSLYRDLSGLDLFRRPLWVAHSTRGALTNTALLLPLGLFAALLWAVYEGVDLWVDGFTSRVRGIGSGGKSGAKRNPMPQPPAAAKKPAVKKKRIAS
jgi:uncharacterized membrane protein